MNYECKTELQYHPLSTAVIDVLILAREWFRCKENAYNRTDLLLLLLSKIQEVSRHKDHSFTKIKPKFSNTDATLNKSYVSGVAEASSDLAQFMSLFNHLIKCTRSGEESQTAMLDRDLKNSVISVFVRRCVQEYQRLTFSQICCLYKQWSSDAEFIPVHTDTETSDSQGYDFSYCLHKLMVQQTNSKQLEVEGLGLAQLHGTFRHNEEGIYALQESIRLAQQMNNSVLLEYSLGWLHTLQPMESNKSLIILSRFIKNAEELRLPVLVLWGKLQQAKALSDSGHHPKRVLQVLMSSELDCSSVYIDQNKVLSQRISLIASQGAALKYFGHKLANVFYSLLPCFIENCTYDEKSFMLSIHSIAQHLLEKGNYVKCIKLLRSVKNYLKPSVTSFKILRQLMEETAFDSALNFSKHSIGRQHLHNIITFNADSAKLRSIQLTKRKEEFSEGFNDTHVLLQRIEMTRDTSFLCDCWLLIADMLSKSGSAALALPYVMHYIRHCEEYHLPTHAARVVLAQLQLQLGSAKECLDLVEGCLLHYSTHGSIPNKAKAYFLRAQAKLLMKGVGLQSEDVVEIFSILQLSLSIYQTCHLISEARSIVVLQAHLHNIIGNHTERNQLCVSLVQHS